MEALVHRKVLLLILKTWQAAWPGDQLRARVNIVAGSTCKQLDNLLCILCSLVPSDYWKETRAN